MQGLEPRTNEPESSVLPITPHPNVILWLCEEHYTTSAGFLKRFLLLFAYFGPRIFQGYGPVKNKFAGL